MEWLMIIAFIVVSILDSKKKSEQAKQQREQRQKMQGQPVYRSESAARQQSQAKPKAAEPVSRKPQQASDSPFGGFLKDLEEWVNAMDAEEHPAKPAREKQVVVQTSPKKQSAMPKNRKAAPQAEKKSPAALPTKTLMEMRPDREKREEHTKVTASVKPLKNAFENQENCEHRIELNPNIQYSKQNQDRERKASQTASIEVKTDSEALIQGIIWSEILGKPKAYQPTQPKFQCRPYGKCANE